MGCVSSEVCVVGGAWWNHVSAGVCMFWGCVRREVAGGGVSSEYAFA